MRAWISFSSKVKGKGSGAHWEGRGGEEEGDFFLKWNAHGWRVLLRDMQIVSLPGFGLKLSAQCLFELFSGACRGNGYWLHKWIYRGSSVTCNL